MCFGSTLSYPHKGFLNPRPTRTRPAATSTRTRPANAGTRNPRGLTHPAQSVQCFSEVFCRLPAEYYARLWLTCNRTQTQVTLLVRGICVIDGDY